MAEIPSNLRHSRVQQHCPRSGLTAGPGQGGPGCHQPAPEIEKPRAGAYGAPTQKSPQGLARTWGLRRSWELRWGHRNSGGPTGGHISCYAWQVGAVASDQATAQGSPRRSGSSVRCVSPQSAQVSLLAGITRQVTRPHQGLAPPRPGQSRGLWCKNRKVRSPWDANSLTFGCF